MIVVKFEMLTNAQMHEFSTSGVLMLKQCVSQKAVEIMVERLWDFLWVDRGISRNLRNTWKRADRPTGMQQLSRDGVFNGMKCEPLLIAVGELLGTPTPKSPSQWGIPLLAFPVDQEESWNVPQGKDTWHIDAPARADRCTGIRAFLLLQSVAPEQGPTLVVSGSANIVRQVIHAKNTNRFSSKDVLKTLQRDEPWIDALLNETEPNRRKRLLVKATTTDGSSLQVIPMTGDAGDVVLMDLSSIHSKSSNVSKLPRLAVSQTFTI